MIMTTMAIWNVRNREKERRDQGEAEKERKCADD
jgi:hypothetical protein